mmetsp:Transcript_7698/g.11341  ORF Transcript_7698/g.11341 Transcript_7698/m.11341 type:complete len:369 (-) Transcript_7698:422-1528(-)|eukprot:CAMPEP_0196814126 /NCGR_PEP_ID=MMETSP1362-20130617/41423_1 /TAXON_ID=163516 /ORGANISM="Leptocylindrus danicus, Strain CCMP1856" /LENGTH=368 /DNA_ID=CAMNT_0042190641 /DNA_START=63 /DNA_END=1169 /DNA_ORIENTATION=-
MQQQPLAEAFPLTDEQIQSFRQNGYLVVNDVLSEEELDRARQGMHATLLKYGVDHDNLQETGHNLKSLSSTNGAGGILDVFYPAWKMELCENPKMLAIISQLWECFQVASDDDCSFLNHPFGPFDTNRAFSYIDRICYRIPSEISVQIGRSLSAAAAAITICSPNKSKNSKSWPLQRSLTPHLDCCPKTILEQSRDVSKWRPLQSFISLTDNLQQNTGGFECAPGFHREFDEWARRRKPSKGKGGVEIAPPCVGEFTPIRPVEDGDVLRRTQHIACRAGSFVIWDNRLPHANARLNEGDVPRECVYVSFLPDVDVNRAYVQNQLEKYRHRRVCTDQWVERDENTIEDELDEYTFSVLGRKLMGIESWD